MGQERDKTDKFEELLLKAKEQFRALPVERTPDCPSDHDLHSLCYERNDEPLRQKYMAHIMLCPYCSDYVHKEVRSIISKRDSNAE